MIKIILTALVVAMVLGMIGGIRLLRNNYYWRNQFLIMEADFLKTKLEFWKLSRNNTAIASSNIEAKSVPILLYHGIINDLNWKPDEVNTSFQEFKNQMFALKLNGWQTISLADYLAFKENKKTLPEKSFVLTFDDGRKDSYYPVDPILRALDYSAVMFVITGRSLGPDNEKSPFHLSERELSHMASGGHWELGSHGKNDHDWEIIGPNGEKGHFMSNTIWNQKENGLESKNEFYNRVRSDLYESKRDLEKKLGVKVLGYAYPFGDFGQSSQNFPQSLDILSNIVPSIYSLSFYQAGNSDFPVNYPNNSYLTKRININSPMSAEELMDFLNNNDDKSTPYEDNFSKDNGWLKGWGAFNISNNSMTIGTTEDEDSALTFLGGSYLWKNYSAQTEIKLLRGTAYSMTARFQNESNFLSCEFSDNYVALTQVVNKEEKPDIQALANSALSSGRNAKVGVSVNGNKASCMLDGQTVVSGEIDSHLDHGGIGFKLWETGQKNATLEIRNLKVENGT